MVIMIDNLEVVLESESKGCTGICHLCAQVRHEVPKRQSSTIEMMLADVKQLEFAATMELLKDKDIWIADKGASNHSTFNNDGCVHKQPINISSQGAYGVGRTPECVMDIPMVVCNKHENEMCSILMTGVCHMKNGNFNLFSITRAMMAGRKLNSYQKLIHIKKRSMIITFDIAIKITKGVLHCAHMKRKQLDDEVNGAMPLP